MSRAKVFQTRENSGSMKGTIPSDVVSALKLKNADTLEWELGIEGNKIMATVKKAM